MGVANRAARADDFPGRKFVGELSVRHRHSLIAGGSATLSVTDRCHEPLGDVRRLRLINVTVYLKCTQECDDTPLDAPPWTDVNTQCRSALVDLADA